MQIEPEPIPEKELVYSTGKIKVAGELVTNTRDWLTIRQRDGGLIELRSNCVREILPPSSEQ